MKTFPVNNFCKKHFDKFYKYVPTEPQKDKLGTVGPFSKKKENINSWNESVF